MASNSSTPIGSAATPPVASVLIRGLLLSHGHDWAGRPSAAPPGPRLLSPHLLVDVAVPTRRVVDIAVRHVLLRDERRHRDEPRGFFAGQCTVGLIDELPSLEDERLGDGCGLIVNVSDA